MTEATVTTDDDLIKECKRIQEDSTYTAEVHHIIARRESRKAFGFKFFPALLTLIGAILLINNPTEGLAWVTVVVGALTVLSILLEPEKKSRDHFFAAKNFTVMKHEARSLHEAFKSSLSEEQFLFEVRHLREKYNMLVQFVPPSSDKQAWEEARKRIQDDKVHQPD